MRNLLTISLLAIALVACNQNGSSVMPDDKEAKDMLQGVWVDEESGDVSFRVNGDTIYFADATSMPTYFRIYEDSLYLASGTAYGIVKHTKHLFWFNNQNGDLLKLKKSDGDDDVDTQEQSAPSVLTYTHQVKIDSVVSYNNNRYHWYIAINPTKYKVTKRAYNDDGLEVENVYYDNTVYVSVYQGKEKLFSQNFKKQMFEQEVPVNFLEQAILGNMQFDTVDDQGFHFNATICVPDGAACYLVAVVFSFDGQLSLKLLEY
jgi:hypothetical protein